jgi:hypothetical protein
MMPSREGWRQNEKKYGFGIGTSGSGNQKKPLASLFGGSNPYRWGFIGGRYHDGSLAISDEV